MATSRFADHLLSGTTASRPAANAVPVGTLYASSDDLNVYQSNGSAWAVYIAAPGGGGAVVLLSTQTLGSPGTITFSSISGSYTDLIVTLVARTPGSTGLEDDVIVQLNSDSGGHYHSQMLRSLGNSAAQVFSSYGATQWDFGSCPNTNALASSYMAMEMTIYGYASTSWFKTCRVHNNSLMAASGSSFELADYSAVWAQTAAVTTILLKSGNPNFITGSVAKLYGRS